MTNKTINSLAEKSVIDSEKNLRYLSQPLRAEDIEFRVGASGTDKSGKKWVLLMAYKNARVDMQRLDDAIGSLNWQRRHELINGNLHCHVGIRNPETGEWVFKSDVGVPSKSEAVKGEASDSFKRACTNWGIGRELYSLPTLFTRNIEAASDNNLKRWVWNAEYNHRDLITTLSATFDGKLVGKWDHK